MKGLRVWIGLFFAIVLGLSLTACDGSSPKQHRASAEAVAKAAAEQQKRLEETKERTQTEEKQTRERERAESRKELVKDIRAAFDPKAEASVGDQPTWATELRRGSPQPASEACQKLDRFYQMDWAIGQMDPEADKEYRISWLEIGQGLEEGQARKLHRETGLAAAKSLLAIFNLPRETRRKMRCGRGEGVFDLDDGMRLVKDISRILQAIKAEPKAIGSSPAMLRQVLLKDLREQIAYLRAEIEAGRVKESDGGVNAIRYIAEEATREWSFAPKELGLTTEEVAMLQKKD